jgi:hypothetical protein
MWSGGMAASLPRAGRWWCCGGQGGKERTGSEELAWIWTSDGSRLLPPAPQGLRWLGGRYLVILEMPCEALVLQLLEPIRNVPEGCGRRARGRAGGVARVSRLARLWRPGRPVRKRGGGRRAEGTRTGGGVGRTLLCRQRVDGTAGTRHTWLVGEDTRGLIRSNSKRSSEFAAVQGTGR